MITIVCKANYCRSPVAQYVLAKELDQENVESAGIIDFFESGMDPRSSQYLKSLDIKYSFHSPKKINKRLFEESDLVLAMDIGVLTYLHKNFSNTTKIKAFNFPKNKISVRDPYRFKNIEDYNKEMEKIVLLSKLWVNIIHNEKRNN